MSVPTRSTKSRRAKLGAAVAAVLALTLPATAAVAATETYSSTAPVAFVDGGSAAASVITVGGDAQVINDVDVSLTITHGFLADADILLVGPQGQSVILMSDVGCDASVSNLALTFDQSAGAYLPETSPVASGTYRPTNISPGCDGGLDAFPLAPEGPWGDSLDVFNDTNPVGDWRLFLVDDVNSFTGQVSSWSLTIDAVPPAAPEITSAATAAGTVGEPFSHTFTATGAPAASLTYSDEDLPPGVARSGNTLSGTPSAPGEYSVTATASNGIDPAATQTLTITIDQAPTITSAATAQAFEWTPFTHTFTASGYPTPTLTYTAVELPDGLTLDGDTVSGRAFETGSFEVTVTASNGVDPDAVQTFELTVDDGAAEPTLALAPGQSELTNTEPVVFTLTFDEAPVDLTASDFTVEGSTSGGVVTLEGGPLEWTVSVTGLDVDGWFMLGLDDGSWTDADGRWGPLVHSEWIAIDRTAPELVGPAEPIRTTTDPGRPGATVTFDVTATDAPLADVGPGSVAATSSAAAVPAAVTPADVASQSCVPVSGSFFAIGTTTVECTATDEAGNSAQLAFEVVVVDDEAPVIDAVEDVTVQLADGESSAPVAFEPPSATDNSGQVEVTCDLEPGAALPEGERTVTCAAVDPSANEATTQFLVTVLAAEEAPDEEAPDEEAPDEDAPDEEAPDDDTPGDDDEGTDEDDDDLPRTGTDVATLALGALVLVAAGGALLIASQRRRLSE